MSDPMTPRTAAGRALADDCPSCAPAILAIEAEAVASWLASPEAEEAIERAIQSAYDHHDDHRTRHPDHTGECQDDWPSAWRLAPLVAAALRGESDG